MNKDNKNTSKKKITGKQIAAMICVILLAGLYIVTLLAAIFGKPGTRSLFGLCLMATFVIPLITWVYIWMYGKLTNKHTIADFELEKPDPDQKDQ